MSENKKLIHNLHLNGEIDFSETKSYILPIMKQASCSAKMQDMRSQIY